MSDIQEWLAQVGLQKYASVFAEHEITLDVLRDLTEADVDRLALPTGPRRRLIVAIHALRAATQFQPAVQVSKTPQQPRKTAPHAERRQLTVMLCDVADSSALAERADPEEVRRLIRAYGKTCGEVVARYEGHVAQNRGEGLMVYFGWPNAHEDDAERGVRAALEIVHAVKGVSAHPPLAVRIGVATGTVVVGEVSPADDAEARMAVGETPNLAARLQGLAGPDEIVIAPSTRRLVGGAFELGDLGAHMLKGIAQPVRAWRVDAVQRLKGRFEAVRGGVALTPLVGRQQEIALLLRRWRQACDGEGQVVLVSGEPGIGKSRLVQTLLDSIAQEPYTALRFQCSPYHVHSAMYPMIEQLEFAAGFNRADTPEQKLNKIEAMLVGSPEQRAEAAALGAAMLSLPADRYPPLNLSPQRQKEKTIEAMARQIEELSRRQPVLIVWEDVHWVDPTSEEAINTLAMRAQRSSFMLVITYRPEYTPRWSERADVTMLGLDRLGRSERTELVSNVAGGRALPEAVLAQIVAHTDGVPLFIEELTKSVLESGLLRETGTEYTLQTPLPALAIPASLRDSLLARLDRLTPVKGLIQIGACIGREFSYDLLARVAAMRNDELEEALHKLTEAGLVYRRGAPPDASYTFKHALVQDAAYDSLLKSRRQQLHAQLAEVLERDFADRVANEPELLARHHTQSGSLLAAIPWWLAAGELSIRKSALQEAAGHLQKGLALIEQLPPSPERDDLELSLREPLNAVWTGLRGWPAPQVRENASVVLQLAKRRARAEALALGLWATWVNTITQGRVADSLEWALRLLAEGDQADNRDLQIYGHTAVMISQFYLGHLLESREHGNRVLALYELQHARRWMKYTGHDLKTAVGVWSSQWTWMLGFPDHAMRVNEETDAHAQLLGHPFNLGFALTLGAYVFDYRCEPEPLFQRIAEAERLEREQSVPFMKMVMVPQVEGLARLRTGHVAESIYSLRQGLENWNSSGGYSRVPYLKAVLAEALARRGEVDAALNMIEQVLEQIERPGWQERSHLAEVLRLKGWMLMRKGRHEEAQSSLQASIEWGRRQHAKSWELRSATTLAELYIADRQLGAAREVLAPVYDWFTEGFATHDVKAARRVLESLR